MEDKDYSPEKFYTRSTDGKGHGGVISTKYPPDMISVIDEMVANYGQYRSRGDVLRDAVYHRLAYLQLHNDEIREYPSSQVFHHISRLEYEREQIINRDLMIAHIQEIATSLYQSGDRVRLKRFIETEESNLQSLDSFTRDKIVKILSDIDVEFRERHGK